MKIGDYRFTRILMSFVLVLALILGGQRLWQAYGVDRPLNEAIADVPGVLSCHMDDQSGVIAVKLERDADLGAGVVELERVIARYSKDRLEVRDQRDDHLRNALASVRFQLEEGMHTGLYSDMLDRVDSRLSPLGVSYRLAIDEDRLYVSIWNGDAYLHEMIWRPQGRTPVEG